MQVPEIKRASRQDWIAGLALISLVVPIASVLLGLSAAGQQVVALAVGLACAIGALVGSRSQKTPTQLRWLRVVLACLGLLLNVSLLVVLIGLCGGQVLWGVCQP
jgi:predicted MFS family arabinose efflux permease